MTKVILKNNSPQNLFLTLRRRTALGKDDIVIVGLKKGDDVHWPQSETITGVRKSEDDVNFFLEFRVTVYALY